MGDPALACAKQSSVVGLPVETASTGLGFRCGNNHHANTGLPRRLEGEAGEDVLSKCIKEHGCCTKTTPYKSGLSTPYLSVKDKMQFPVLITLLSAALVAGQTNTNLQTKFPTATSTTALAAVRTIAAGQSLDGKMIQWDRSPSTCQQQTEGGDKDAVFILEDGATLSNVIIGPNNGEGIHCKGQCTLNNV